MPIIIETEAIQKSREQAAGCWTKDTHEGSPRGPLNAEF